MPHRKIATAQNCCALPCWLRQDRAGYFLLSYFWKRLQCTRGHKLGQKSPSRLNSNQGASTFCKMVWWLYCKCKVERQSPGSSLQQVLYFWLNLSRVQISLFSLAPFLECKDLWIVCARCVFPEYPMRNIPKIELQSSSNNPQQRHLSTQGDFQANSKLHVEWKYWIYIALLPSRVNLKDWGFLQYLCTWWPI